MPPRDKIVVKGFVTQYKFIGDRRLQDIEALLGFHAGRLAQGASFASLDRLPTPHEFETAGYSQVAGHRHIAPPDLDPDGLRRLALSAWSATGSDQLIKVLPKIIHDPTMLDDTQYPPGLGIPQWNLTSPVPGTIVAVVPRYNEVFRLN